LGYTRTLLAIRDQFKKPGVPLGYMELDRWSYPKGVDTRWNSLSAALPDGEYTYRADKELFPEGLAAFQQSLGLLMAINSWKRGRGVHSPHVTNLLPVIRTDNLWLATVRKRDSRFRPVRKSCRQIQTPTLW
jgi:hypothetical protein